MKFLSIIALILLIIPLIHPSTRKLSWEILSKAIVFFGLLLLVVLWSGPYL